MSNLVFIIAQSNTAMRNTQPYLPNLRRQDFYDRDIETQRHI